MIGKCPPPEAAGRKMRLWPLVSAAGGIGLVRRRQSLSAGEWLKVRAKELASTPESDMECWILTFRPDYNSF